jgi:hypothetical protein
VQTDNVFLIVCGTLLLVLIINAGILVAFLRPNASSRVKVLGKAIEAIRNPLSKGNEDLKELHQRVSELEKQGDEENTHG